MMSSEAFERFIYVPYHKFIVTMVRRWIGKEEWINDLVQEVLLTLYCETDNRESIPISFVYKVTLYKVTKFLRYIYRQKRNIGMEIPVEHITVSSNDDVETRMIVKDLLSKLEQRQREIILGLYFEQYSYSSLARELKIAKNTVNSTAYKSLKKLRRIA